MGGLIYLLMSRKQLFLKALFSNKNIIFFVLLNWFRQIYDFLDLSKVKLSQITHSLWMWEKLMNLKRKLE